MASKKFKLIILDEADAMTKDAQNALRRIIEKFTDNVRFCLICNYLSKIIPAVQSRCTRFRFAPLSKELMIPRLQHIIQEENLKVTEDGLKALVTLAQGDMRRSINILQCSSMAFDDVNEENVYTSNKRIYFRQMVHDIERNLPWVEKYRPAILEDLVAHKDIVATTIAELKTAKGLALQDILTEVHVYVHRLELPAYVKIYIFEKMSDIEHRLSTGSSEKIQLSALISTFYTARNSISTKDA
uniref:Activator 1 subunit 5 n=1 Tax=Romanomermis culicivorax TaxID=13658 RepID=A0A915KTB0_ROMCU